MKIERKSDVVIIVPRQGASPISKSVLEVACAVAQERGARFESTQAASGKEREMVRSSAAALRNQVEVFLNSGEQ